MMKILVVDDEMDLREILKFNLESEGYIVDCASSGEEALEMVSKEHKLILLDVMMEGISGFKTAERMRRELMLDTPIIFLTAKTTENDMLTGFSVGGDDYINKPFSIKEVSARVKAILRRSAQDSDNQDIMEFEGMTVNMTGKELFIDGEPVLLTKTEFNLLVLLSSNSGKILSREEILNKVWSGDVYVLERTVDVHITRLRKKLGAYGRFIVNRSGYGYCFDVRN